MGLRFPYRSVQIGQPALTVGGSTFRLRPLADLSVSGPANTIIREAVFDTGADEIILPESYALLLGVDLSVAPSGTSSGVGSPPLNVLYAAVTLRLSDGQEFRQWSALVGFTPALRSRILFGIAHGLEYFTATFRGDLREVELEPNTAYPGT